MAHALNTITDSFDKIVHTTAVDLSGTIGAIKFAKSDSDSIEE